MARQIDLDHTPDKDGGLNDYVLSNAGTLPNVTLNLDAAATG